jgi:hypothetical protein
MRKRITGAERAAEQEPSSEWLDLENLAAVELTSEDPAHPIEAAFRAAAGRGWRAAAPGPQTIRLIFDQPQAIRRIRLVFRETADQRTQEFTLRWSPDGGQTYHEAVRQQYTFSPPGTSEQVEDYRVELHGVTVLALAITPDIGGAPVYASLAALQVG